MTTDEHRRDTPLLDEWRADVGDDARRKIADGSTPGFTNEAGFLTHFEDTPRRSA